MHRYCDMVPSWNHLLGTKLSCRAKPETTSTRGGAEKDHGDRCGDRKQHSSSTHHNDNLISEAYSAPPKRKKVKPAYVCLRMYIRTFTYLVQRMSTDVIR